MKNIFKFGLLTGCLLAILFACSAPSASASVNHQNNFYCEEDQSLQLAVEFDALQLHNYALDVSNDQNAAKHYVGSCPPGAKEYALHVAELRIKERSTYGFSALNFWAPRKGSYYYLMGDYINPSSGFRS